MNPARLPLVPLSLAYGAIIRARNAWFDHRAGAVRRAAVPVISVGNITVGGTGKTPLTLELARRLEARGRRPAILTRGYHAAPGQEADEVLEFRATIPSVPVVVDADRVAGARRAVHEHSADVLLLDDGFQHRRLARDLDVVLIDALDPWGGGWLLPAGRLREPPAGLRRADLLVITRSNQVAARRLDTALRDLARRAPGTPVVRAGVVADALVSRDGTRQAPAELAGQRVLAVCGLGNPATFATLLASLGTAHLELRRYADHHRYAPRDVDRLFRTAEHLRADQVVTTRKDWVKLAPHWPAHGVPLARLDVRIDFGAGGEPLEAALDRALENAT